MTEKKNVFEITDEEAQTVSGGNAAETQELYEFFKRHEPDLVAQTDSDTSGLNISPYYGAGVLVEQTLGIMTFSYMKDRRNLYVDSEDRVYTHAEIMQMLREKYGE